LGLPKIQNLEKEAINSSRIKGEIYKKIPFYFKLTITSGLLIFKSQEISLTLPRYNPHMNDNLSYFSKIDSLFDRFGGPSEGIIALFVNTNNASQKFMVCCRRDDTISSDNSVSLS